MMPRKLQSAAGAVNSVGESPLLRIARRYAGACKLGTNPSFSASVGGRYLGEAIIALTHNFKSGGVFFLYSIESEVTQYRGTTKQSQNT